MGWIRLTVTSAVPEVVRTRFPGRSSRLPAFPAIGERIVAFLRLILALSTAARSARTVASSAVAVARA